MLKVSSRITACGITRNKYAILAIILIFFLVPSCKRSAKQISVSELIASVPPNRSGVEDLLVGAYDLLDGAYSNHPNNLWATGSDNKLYGSVAACEAYGKCAETGTVYTAGYKITSTDPLLEQKWQINLEGIIRADAVISKLALVKDGSVSSDYATKTIAEAHFLRGFYELELAKLWPNVPGNNNTGTAWNKIEDDFAAAMHALPVTQHQFGRPNKYAAEAFLAKTYLYAHQYTQAKPLLTDLILNGVASSGNKYTLEAYAYNFNPSVASGPECVFAILVHADNNKNCPTDDCSNFRPAFSLVNAFKTDAKTGLPLLNDFNNSDLENDQGIASDIPFIPTAVTLDPRLDWTVGRRGVPYLDWGIMPGTKWVKDQSRHGPYIPIKYVYYQGAQEAEGESNQDWAMKQSATNGYDAIRFADVLLWAAEVETEIGSLQKAEDYVNRVRQRAADRSGWVHAYKDPENPINGCSNTPAANYKIGLYGIAGANPATGFVTAGKDYARKAIYHERMIELGMEGHRYFDLQRWDGLYGGPMEKGYLSKTLNSWLAHERASLKGKLSTVNFTAKDNNTHAVPHKKRSIKPEQLTQNAGY